MRTSPPESAPRNYELVFFRNAVQTPILQLRNWFFPGGAWVVNSGFNDPAAAALLTEAGSSSDPAKIKDLLRKLELLAVEDSSYIPLTSQFSLSGIRHARGVVEAVTPGEYLFVRTTPPLPGKLRQRLDEGHRRISSAPRSGNRPMRICAAAPIGAAG